MKDEAKTREQLIKELKESQVKIAKFKELELERKRAEERIKHLNRVLRAIRNVNQLIIREKNRDALIQKTCKILVETRVYYNAWILLLDEKGKYLTSARTGLDKNFAPMKKLLEQGKWTDCGKKALKQKELIITEDPKKECPDCPLSLAYAKRGGYTVCLAYHDRIYGLLSVSIPKSFIKDKQEQELLREVAGDIGFALHTIEMEKKRLVAEKGLLTSKALLPRSQEIAHIGSWNLNLTNNQLLWSDETYRIFGLEPQEFEATYEAFIQTVHPEDRTKVDTAYSRSIREGKDSYEIEHRVIRKHTGEVRHVHEKCIHIRDATGTIVRSTGMVQDITESKKAEEAVKESEKNFKDMAENLADGVIIANEDGKIIYVNPQIKKITGYSSEELLHMTGWDMTHPEDIPIFKGRMKKRLEGIPHLKHYERVLVRKDGSEVYTEFSTTTTQWKGKMRPLAIVRDITERRQAEEVLEENEKRYRQIYQFSPDSIILHDMDMNILDANNKAVEEFGYSKVELLKKKVFELHPETELKHSVQVLDDMNKKDMLNVETKFVRKNGSVFVAEATPCKYTLGSKPIIHVVIRDITERRQAEKQMRESEERYFNLFNNANDLIHIISPDGKILDVNKKWLATLEYSHEDVKGLLVFDIIRKDKIQQISKMLQSVIRGENIIVETVFISKSGKEINVEGNGNCIFKDGKLNSCIGIFRDITEPKQAENQILIANERLKYLLSSSSAAIYTAKASGDYGATFISEYVIKMVGYKPEEFLEDSSFWIDHIHPEDLPRISVEVSRVFEQEHHCYEYRFRCKDSKYIWVRDEMQLIRNKKGNPVEIIGYWINITERKRAEEALQESERNYRNLIEASTDGIYLLYNRKFEIVNKKFLEMLHITKKDLNKPDFDFMNLVAPQSRPLIKVRTQKSAKGEKLESTYEFTGLTKDGKEIEIETSVSYVKYKESIATLGIFRDITDRKLAREALQRSEEKYKSLTNQIPVGVYRTTEKGEFLHANLALANILGFDNVEKLMEISASDVYDDPRIRHKQLEQWKKRGEILSKEIKFRTRKGKKILVHDTGKIILNKNGGIDYIDGIVEDITERKRAEENLKRSLKEKEVLLQEIHHRVKNNLMVIIGLFHFYTSDLKNKKVKSLLSNIESTIHSIILIHEMLYKSSSLELIDFKYYVMELMSYLQAMHHMDSSLLNVEIDIGKVFLNLKTAIPCGMIINELISNILKHAFPPALIDRRSKSIKNREKPCHILVHLSEKRKVKSGRTFKPLEYTMVIRDNGVGFLEDYDFGKSRSLGLNLVNLMVKQLDGEVEFENKNGTVITIHFKKQ